MVQYSDPAPRLVGSVNITTDSFSDGGRFLTADDAIAQARRLRAAGADIVELGPASSHPDAEQVSAAEERHRLADVLDQLIADGIPVSVRGCAWSDVPERHPGLPRPRQVRGTRGTPVPAGGHAFGPTPRTGHQEGD